MNDFLNLESPTAPWLNEEAEGELHIDAFRDGSQLVLRSAAPGVKAEDIELTVDGDLLTIRGQRKQNYEINDQDWFMQECYWGGFSRSLVLPLDVDTTNAIASMKDGILEIRLPIRQTAKTIPVRS